MGRPSSIGRGRRIALAQPASVLSLGFLAAVAACRGQDEAAGDVVFASFVFQDGSREWRPADVLQAIDNIEALQEMEHGGLHNMLWELDRDPWTAPSEEDLERAWELYRRSFEVARRRGWFDIANGERDGFYYDVADPYHYPNDRNLLDGRELVPERPEFLMYYPSPARPSEKILVGFMYQTSSFATHGAQVGGGLTRWHKHVYGLPVCFRRNGTPDGSHAQGPCQGVRSSRSPEMLHVWFVDHPVSRFASDMFLDGEVIERPVPMTREQFMARHQKLPEWARE